VRTGRSQCKEAGVPFWFMSWGDWVPMMGHTEGIAVKHQKETLADGTIMGWAGAGFSGRTLDGVIHNGEIA
jgi:hypothetical protein